MSAKAELEKVKAELEKKREELCSLEKLTSGEILARTRMDKKFDLKGSLKKVKTLRQEIAELDQEAAELVVVGQIESLEEERARLESENEGLDDENSRIQREFDDYMAGMAKGEKLLTDMVGVEKHPLLGPMLYKSRNLMSRVNLNCQRISELEEEISKISSKLVKA